MKKTNNNIYVDLDALFDLRLGVLNVLNTDFAFSVTKSITYFTRLNDSFYSNDPSPDGKVFGKLDKTLFDQVYASVNKKRLIENSFYTKIPLFVVDLAKNHLINLVRQGIDSNIEIHFNIFPLNIQEAHRVVIEDSLYKLTGDKFKIKIISIDIDKVSVSSLVKEYFAIVKYDYVNWFNSKEKELKETAVSDCCLYVPRIFMGDAESEETKLAMEEYKRIGGTTDMFEITSRAISAYFPIQFIPVSAYCIGLPTNPFKIGVSDG